MNTMHNLENVTRMEREHAAWMDVVTELRDRGVGDIEAINGEKGKDWTLWAAIVKWAEELHQLRAHDPDPEHAEHALAETRERYPGCYETGHYPASE